jgi:hypothetical protein
LFLLLISVSRVSEEYASVIKCALNAAFDRLLRTLDKNLFAGKSMNSTAAAASEPKIVELPDDAPGRPLASFLPEITKAAHSILNCYPNEHVKVCV